MLQQTRRALPLVAMLALAACSSANVNLGDGPMINRPNPNYQTAALAQPAVVTPRTATANAQAMTDVTAFIDPSALGILSEKERTEASSAQFGALSFGRPGAPRQWQGDRGNSGNVTVGPFVRVNNIDCRDFTHTVNAGGQAYVKKGTACREADGSWTVAQT
jgi:surface antigen